jgi:hypothetical protein
MENEAQISYLRTQATNERLTLDEESKLLRWIVIEPKLLDLITIEGIIRNIT